MWLQCPLRGVQPMGPVGIHCRLLQKCIFHTARSFPGNMEAGGRSIAAEATVVITRNANHLHNPLLFATTTQITESLLGLFTNSGVLGVQACRPVAQRPLGPRRDRWRKRPPCILAVPCFVITRPVGGVRSLSRLSCSPSHMQVSAVAKLPRECEPATRGNISQPAIQT